MLFSCEVWAVRSLFMSMFCSLDIDPGAAPGKIEGGAYGGFGYQTPLKNKNFFDLGLFKLKILRIRRKI